MGHAGERSHGMDVRHPNTQGANSGPAHSRPRERRFPASGADYCALRRDEAVLTTTMAAALRLATASAAKTHQKCESCSATRMSAADTDTLYCCATVPASPKAKVSAPNVIAPTTNPSTAAPETIPTATVVAGPGRAVRCAGGVTVKDADMAISSGFLMLWRPVDRGPNVVHRSAADIGGNTGPGTGFGSPRVAMEHIKDDRQVRLGRVSLDRSMYSSARPDSGLNAENDCVALARLEFDRGNSGQSGEIAGCVGRRLANDDRQTLAARTLRDLWCGRGWTCHHGSCRCAQTCWFTHTIGSAARYGIGGNADRVPASVTD